MVSLDHGGRNVEGKTCDLEMIFHTSDKYVGYHHYALASVLSNRFSNRSFLRSNHKEMEVPEIVESLY